MGLKKWLHKQQHHSLLVKSTCKGMDKLKFLAICATLMLLTVFKNLTLSIEYSLS
jgi:hypothetical protein